MAVTINDIKKLRDMTGAGLSDCKKALIESDNDITKAMELIRKRGQRHHQGYGPDPQARSGHRRQA